MLYKVIAFILIIFNNYECEIVLHCQIKQLLI